MLRIAWKNLRQDLTRTGLSIGGVAAAVLLILTLQGIFTGTANQIAVYIDESKADVFVAQAGIRNMHMANSVVPAGAQERLERVPGVKAVVPILYFAGTFEMAGDELIGYVIGLDSASGVGGPWRMAEGSSRPGRGEVVVAKSLAAPRGLKVGDRMQVMGRSFRISGLSLDTESFVSSFLFMSMADARALRSDLSTANYLLVAASDPAGAEALARRIEEEVPGVSALSRPALAESDRQVAIQMGLNVIQAMSVAALIVGLTVIMLTLYAATVEKSREYGILKALGASNLRLFGVVLAQAAISTLGGFALGVAATWAVSVLVAVYVPEVSIVLETPAVARTFFSVLPLALIGSLLPAWRIVRVDPMVVFKS